MSRCTCTPGWEVGECLTNPVQPHQQEDKDAEN